MEEYRAAKNVVRDLEFQVYDAHITIAPSASGRKQREIYARGLEEKETENRIVEKKKIRSSLKARALQMKGENLNLAELKDGKKGEILFDM